MGINKVKKIISLSFKSIEKNKQHAWYKTYREKKVNYWNKEIINQVRKSESIILK